MTLKRLQFVQFGPYAEPQTIDFSRFADHNLFLIHGATGAGKSFVLDAICYALYGESSGSDRDATDLRSQYATPRDPTEVTLDFQLGAKHYRVKRRPKMQLAKKRGSGTTERGPDAWLWDRTDIAETDDDAEGTLLADGKRDVIQQIEDLLGLKAAQFRQVVVLPQGQFRAFLAASSTEREDILKVLFDTQQFADLEAELKAMYQEAQEEAASLRSTRTALLSQHDVESGDALQEKRDEKKEALTQAHATRKEKTSALRKAQDALQEARKAQQRLDAVEEAENRVAELRPEQEEQEARTQRAEQAEEAERVSHAEARMQERKSDYTEAKEALQAANEAHDDAEAALAAAQSALDAERAHDDAREALKQDVRALREARDDVAQLAAKEEAAASARQTLADAEQARDTQSAEIEQLESEAATARSTIAAHENEAQTAEARATDVEMWKSRLEHAQKLEQLTDAHAEAQSALDDATERVEACQAAYATHKKRVRELEQARDEGYASVLAARLTDGDPCPVCGATSHPHPADDAHDVPNAATLEAARTKRDDAESALDDAKQARRSAERDVDQHASTIKALRAQDEALTAYSVSEIEAELASATEALASARNAQSTVSDATATLEALTDTLAEKRDALEAQKETVREAKSAVERAETDVDRIAADVPEGIDSVDALDAQVADLKAKHQAYEDALQNAQEELESAKTDYTKAQTNLENARTQSETAQQKHAKAQKQFREALQAHGFEDRSAYEAAQMTSEALRTLRKRIQTVATKWANAQANLREAKARAEGITEPDVEGAEAKVEALNERLSTLDQKIGGLQEARTALDDALEQLSAIRDEARAAEEKAERIGHLSEVARGGQGNERNISLQRYVLAARLKDVLQVANTHLRRMSQGQYHLRRATKLDDKRSSGGLDLRVHDAHTNEERAVSTLSGGEGFNAALALALGLSDVVQRRTGGRRLNTLFIDEGFGTLDQDTLELALEVLRDVQEQQRGRLLGIISHVTELKRRLPARLSVKAAQDGSTVEVEA